MIFPAGNPEERCAVVVAPPTPRPLLVEAGLLSERDGDAGTMADARHEASEVLPRSESSLVHWLAFRLVDAGRKWRAVV